MYAAQRFEVIRKECRQDKWYYNHAAIPETVVQAAEGLVKLMGDHGPDVIDPFDGGIEMEWGKRAGKVGGKFEVCVAEDDDDKIEFFVLDAKNDEAPGFETAQEVYDAYGDALKSARKD